MSGIQGSKNPIVSIQKDTYEDLDINSLLKPLGGLKNYVNKDEKILLKTNLLNATTPERAVVTHPILVKSVAKEVLKLGATPVIGDSPSGPFTKRRLRKVYNKSGMTKLSKELGIELNYDTKNTKIEIPDGKKLKKSSICNFYLNADKIISLPKLKTHYYMIMTLATKIMFGVVPGLVKAKYHSQFIRKKDFADMILDILSVSKPDLVIMDGIVAMQGEGPMSGIPVELGVLLASTNSVALDLSVCRMLDIEPTGIYVLKQAKIRKLWPKEINYPLLFPEDVKYKDFILPSNAGYLLTGEKKPNKYPFMNEKCTACKDCVQICPKKAIKIIEGQAKVDYSKCIQCYCCHEVCTYNAINLKR